jgi:hypothetical protein
MLCRMTGRGDVLLKLDIEQVKTNKKGTDGTE